MNRVVQKLTSGQWILTIAGAWTFAWMACHEQLPAEAVTALLGMIFTSYFKRERNNEQGQSNG